MTRQKSILTTPIRWVTVALGGLAMCYMSLGMYALVFPSDFSYPVDLRLRWIEQRFVAQGQNPQNLTYPADLLPDQIRDQQNVRGSYPPWSYGTGLVLAPPIAWPAVCVYFACINAIAMLGLGYWVLRQGDECGAGWGWLAVTSVFAAFPFCVCLSYGQYSIVVLALIVASLEFLRRGHSMVAGVAIGIAAVKPQLAGLFFLVPLVYPLPVREKARFLFGAATYIAISSCIVAWYVGSTPWEMLQGTAAESVKFYQLSNNPLLIWSVDLVGFSPGSKLLAMFVGGFCAVVLLFIRRQNNLLAGFGICAIFAMYWSYSRHYDLVLFTVTLIALLVGFRKHESGLAGLALLLICVLLWAPIRIGMSRWPLVELAFAMVNVLALVGIVVSEKRLCVVPQVSRFALQGKVT